jgi:hypothetical protein
MKVFLTISVLGMLIAGCASQPGSGSSTEEVVPNNPVISSSTTEVKVIQSAGTGIALTALPVMTVNAPAIMITPIPGNHPTPSTPNSISPQNWQPFTSAELGVTVDYPADWSVSEDAGVAAFKSPAGVVIKLNADRANPDKNELKIGNRYCTSRTNKSHLTADICVDNAAFIYTAKFALHLADGSTHWITLSTQARAAGNVFEAMFNSVRLNH